jgi:hypothetical protein
MLQYPWPHLRYRSLRDSYGKLAFTLHDIIHCSIVCNWFISLENKRRQFRPVRTGSWGIEPETSPWSLAHESNTDIPTKQTCGSPVAHICNPSYSGGRDQEDRGSKPTRAHSSWDPILKDRTKQKKTHHSKRAGRVAEGVGPKFKPQYRKNKTKQKKPKKPPDMNTV